MKQVYSDTSSVREYHLYQGVITKLKIGEKVRLVLKKKENGYEDVFVNTNYGEAGQLFSENGDEIKKYFGSNNYSYDASVKKIIEKEDGSKMLIVGYDIFESEHPINQPIQNNANVNPQQNKKKNGCLKWALILFVSLLVFSWMLNKCLPEDKEASSAQILKVEEIKTRHCKIIWKDLDKNEKEKVLNEFIDNETDLEKSNAPKIMAVYLLKNSVKYPETLEDNGYPRAIIKNIDKGIIEYQDSFTSENKLSMKVKGHYWFKIQYNAGCKPYKVISFDIE